MVKYNPAEIEAKWQRFWSENNTFRAIDFSQKPKYYILDMFPYPSGAGLHVGHPEGYTATDILARYKRMRGFNVLHPMGWDAFGLPAEQYALETGTHPALTTSRNIATFKRQIRSLGFSYDWEREINTTDPAYYRWTQWIFAQLYEKGLAYIAEVPVNWCPALGTVLANEEVIGGVSERGGHPVVRKPMRQWMLRITAYAERLLRDLDDLDWPESIKEMQRNWIGRSEGAEIDFPLTGDDDAIRVFTTRPDTLFGATYMVLAPEHPLVDKVTTPERHGAVASYRELAASKSDLERTDLAKEKTGVFTGGYATNPVNDERIPIWISDYVLITYGTGAIMAVPGHDQRDWEFAHAFALPIIEVISGGDIGVEVYVGEGAMVNSGRFDGTPSEQGKHDVTAWLAERGLARECVHFRLRDWLFSRQRYWGEPFPVIHAPDGSHKLVPTSDLPVLLPEVDKFQTSGTGESPLACVEQWVQTADPETGAPARRETNTMPQWAGSCWYYLRYIDPGNNHELVSTDKEDYWMPVDLYVGGAEHAVLHLLYARFWHKVLYDLGVVSTSEPFTKLVNQGMILGLTFRDGRGALVDVHDVAWRDDSPVHKETGEELSSSVEKMSKSLRNVVNPDEVIAEHGADAFRLYLMFMGPLESTKPWDSRNVSGVFRFLRRVFHLFVSENGELNPSIQHVEPDHDTLVMLHKTIKKVSEDTEGLRFNTAIAQMMTFVNHLYKLSVHPRSVMEPVALLLAPYAPHLAEELWERLGHAETLAYESWPSFDESLTVDELVTLAVQINGKIRGTLEIARDISKESAVAAAKEVPNVIKHLTDKTVVKEIFVPGRMVSFVVR